MVTYFYSNEGDLWYAMKDYNFYQIHGGHENYLGRIVEDIGFNDCEYLLNNRNDIVGFINPEDFVFSTQTGRSDNSYLGRLDGNDVYQLSLPSTHYNYASESMIGYTEGEQSRYLGAFAVWWWNYQG